MGTSESSDERLPEEYERCFVGINSILREAWNTATAAENDREKIQALSLAKECYSMKLELLTNATVVDDALRFVYQKSEDRENLKSTVDNSNEEESNELDYNEDRDQLEEEQEEEAGETTVNQVF